MLASPLQHRLEEMRLFWARLFRRSGPEAGPIRLDRRRVYVLPTRAGVLFAFVLLAMLLGAINYNNSLAYALTFLLASLTVVSILHTFRNLHGLTFHAGHPPSLFAHSTARFPLGIENSRAARFAITLQWGEADSLVVDVPADEMEWIELHCLSDRRGWLPLPRITVTTSYPLGLFRAWGYLHLTARALVYPAPAAEQPLPRTEVEGSGSGGDLGRGSDDFALLRPYHAGDSLRHVHWKAFAREQGLVVKQFGATRAPELWLTWESAGERDTEARLSRLCRWVLQAEAAGIAYGLLLPTLRIEPAQGEAQRRRALEALALYGKESD
jgi:uncharacterized protein (DUF58 family)